MKLLSRLPLSPLLEDHIQVHFLLFVSLSVFLGSFVSNSQSLLLFFLTLVFLWTNKPPPKKKE